MKLPGEQLVESPGGVRVSCRGMGRLINRVFGPWCLLFDGARSRGAGQGCIAVGLYEEPLFGRFLTSMPFFNYGGILSESAGARDALLDAAAETARNLKATHIELRHEAPLETRWPVRSHKVSMRLELPRCYEDLLKAFPSKLRSQIRRGEREGMTSRLGGLELLEDFYQVFARNMRDLGTPVYGKAFFREILQTFSKEARICGCILPTDRWPRGLSSALGGTWKFPGLHRIVATRDSRRTWCSITRCCGMPAQKVIESLFRTSPLSTAGRIGSRNSGGLGRSRCTGITGLLKGPRCLI